EHKGNGILNNSKPNPTYGYCFSQKKTRNDTDLYSNLRIIPRTLSIIIYQIPNDFATAFTFSSASVLALL
ncbi:hypothetical protein EZS27_038254, partial [termite gut metagenome]